VIVGYLLWRRFAGRSGETAATPALVIGILSLVLAFFYWTGLVYFVAPLGIALGTSNRDGRARAGLALSAISLIGAIVIGVIDAIL
jgi:hypothetical protein